MQAKQASLIVMLQTSKQLLAYLLIVHCLMLYISIIALPFSLAIVITLLLIVHLAWLVKHYAKPTIQRVDLNGNADVTIYDQQGQKVHYTLVHSYTCYWFVILTLSSKQSLLKKRVFICHDAIDKDLFRKLTVYLKQPKLYLR